MDQGGVRGGHRQVLYSLHTPGPHGHSDVEVDEKGRRRIYACISERLTPVPVRTDVSKIHSRAGHELNELRRASQSRRTSQQLSGRFGSPRASRDQPYPSIEQHDNIDAIDDLNENEANRCINGGLATMEAGDDDFNREQGS